MELNQLSVCRCCLTENRKMKDMTDLLALANKQKITLICCYSACSGVDPSQNFPQIARNICKPCEKKLAKAYEFREMCQESDRVLHERFKILSEVKIENLSDEDLAKEYLYAESKPEPDQPSQSFSQVFLKDHNEVALSEAVIKIEDDPPPEPHPEKDERFPITEDGNAVKSPASDDNVVDYYKTDAESSTSDEEVEQEGQKKEQGKEEDHEVDNLVGKFLCFQCDLVLQSIREYREHRKICIETRNKQSCKICNESVKGYKRHLEEKHKDFKPFECGSCEAKYANFNSLRIHLYYHTKRKTFQCMAQCCGLKFHSPADLRRHIIDNNKHKINHYHCHVCGSDYPKFQELDVHYQNHKDDETLNIVNRPLVPCFQCKKIFVHRKVFFAHKCEPVADILERWQSKKTSKAKIAKYRLALSMRWTKVFIDTTPQTCQICKKIFTNDDEFACHKNSECIEKRKYICADCGKEFITLQRMKSHSEVHVKNRQYICDMCGNSFISKVGLAKHKASHTDGRTFKCTLCPASFVDKNGLKSHSYVHEEKKYECDYCARRFRKYENIRLHMSIHSMDLQKFLCEICNKRFPRKTDINKHNRNFHSGLKPMNCGFCKRVFRDPAIFKRHQRDMHSQITYECSHCQKMFNTGEGLKAHLFVHRGFYPFNCPACPRKFIKKYMFSKHLMKGHSIKYDEKTHGYRETELNMRQILLDAERRPNNAPIKGRMNMIESHVNDMDVKHPPEPVNIVPFTGITDYSGFPAVAAPWNSNNQPFDGYSHSNRQI